MVLSQVPFYKKQYKYEIYSINKKIIIKTKKNIPHKKSYFINTIIY